MPTMPHPAGEVILGVDTHELEHVAALVDELGRLLATASFPATAEGYRHLLAWPRDYGLLRRAGVEGTGSFGAGLTRYLAGEGVSIIEVTRPNRRGRRHLGKSDTVDSEAAARMVLSGEATATPKRRDGIVESIRVLQIARRSAIKARTQAGQQIRSLARRWQQLDLEVRELDRELRALVREAAPRLLEEPGIGPDTAAKLLVIASDNPGRLRSDAAFAALCGVSPIEASSGKSCRHRLNKGGDRQGNNARWTIANNRLIHHPETRAYAARRSAEGLSRKEILRCLKRQPRSPRLQAHPRRPHPPQPTRLDIGASTRWPKRGSRPSRASSSTAAASPATRRPNTRRSPGSAVRCSVSIEIALHSSEWRAHEPD